MPTDRPATPPALQRNITNFSGANAAKAAAAAAGGLKHRNAFRQRANIESLMQSTAKNIHARGESLGIGKAVRNAVDEVHKRAQEIRDTQIPSLQFVQVYLSDPSLPLSEPNAETTHVENGTEQDSAARAAAGESSAVADHKARLEGQPGKADTVESESSLGLADPSTFEEDDDSLISTPTLQSSAPAAPTNPTDHSVSHDNTDINIDASSPQSRSNERVARADRPALAEGSFSWMLDQEHPSEVPVTSKTSPKPDQARSRGILFGEQEEIDTSPTQVKRSSERGRKQKVPATKVPTGDTEDVGDLR